jgi:maleate isomerase
MCQPDGWGSHARIGVLVPHNDVVPESEFWAMAPEGVSIHAARVPLGWRSGSEPPLIGLDAVQAFAEPPHVDEVAALLAGASLDVINYAFTSSSYILGPDGDVALKSRLEQRTHGIPVLISCLSAALALRTLGLHRLALIHPPWFPAEIDRLGAEYFRNQGFEVVHAAAAQIEGGQLAIEPSKVYEWACAHVPAAAEALFLGGGGFRVVGAIQALEKALGRPVLSANQVLVWHALRLARVAVPVVNYGQIFSRELPN